MKLGFPTTNMLPNSFIDIGLIPNVDVPNEENHEIPDSSPILFNSSQNIHEEFTSKIVSAIKIQERPRMQPLEVSYIEFEEEDEIEPILYQLNEEKENFLMYSPKQKDVTNEIRPQISSIETIFLQDFSNLSQNPSPIHIPVIDFNLSNNIQTSSYETPDFLPRPPPDTPILQEQITNNKSKISNCTEKLNCTGKPSKLFPSSGPVALNQKNPILDNRPALIVSNSLLNDKLFCTFFSDCKLAFRSLETIDIEISPDLAVILCFPNVQQISKALVVFKNIMIVTWGPKIQNDTGHPLIMTRHFQTIELAYAFIKTLARPNPYLKTEETLHEMFYSLFPTISHSIAQEWLRYSSIANPIIEKDFFEKTRNDRNPMNSEPFSLLLDAPVGSKKDGLSKYYDSK